MKVNFHLWLARNLTNKNYHFNANNIHQAGVFFFLEKKKD